MLRGQTRAGRSALWRACDSVTLAGMTARGCAARWHVMRTRREPRIAASGIRGGSSPAHVAPLAEDRGDDSRVVHVQVDLRLDGRKRREGRLWR